jgi:hypothetical protein
MKIGATRLLMAMGLLALSNLGTGCASEPEGSCTTREVGSFSGEPGSYEVHEVCQPNSTASLCTPSGGKFTEGDDCFLFNLFHPPT